MYVVRGLSILEIFLSLKDLSSLFAECFLLLDLFCQKIEQFTESPVIHVHGVADLKSAFRNTDN